MGGHKTSHTKPKKIKIEQEGTTQGPRPKVGHEHICDKCNKSFESGTALGGHKRCHYTGPVIRAKSSSNKFTSCPGPVEALSPSSQQDSCSTEVSNKNLQVHNFDLNEPPTMEVEDRPIYSAGFAVPGDLAAAYGFLVHS
ncbi:zf-C2H2_6 domain-containing protein [Cephalotus follicularis]|uniref:Zf-C2H2_6 domain-containing protein n=1 Tax=Cephalotus follicularis TaxID=3775 RepID=A0A1Q3BSJ7_CEPFO|nr:zf-C2H2_6 domain-containing protein [Cephalotus follicularis]